ncbi:DUF488 domain-containing protein [Campylobacter lari]|nr:DUF488 domain-containing protein [Campylobacter lari]EAK0797946.1 DUF488 domain-containing protein [Campylobacter lari]
MKTIYTIGHSTHNIDYFIHILKQENINAIVDIRSSPYSKFANHFNREYINKIFKNNGINYIFMGDMLGARWEDKELLFENGKVNFELVSQTKLFKQGIDRLINGVNKGYNISLMCSEKEPFDCHRFALVSRYINDINISHIYPKENEIIEFSQKDLENKMLEKYKKKLPQNNLFNNVSHIEKLNQAYKLRNIDIAYNALTKQGDEE